MCHLQKSKVFSLSKPHMMFIRQQHTDSKLEGIHGCMTEVTSRKGIQLEFILSLTVFFSGSKSDQ